VVTGSRTKNRTSKADRARATRRRIVAAATTLFLRDGFLTTTMASIAAEAGVAVQTLYLSFGNKTAILSAAFDVALVGDDERVPIPGRDWYRAVIEDPDGPAALARFVHHSGVTMRRASPLYAVIQAASAEPEIAELLANNKRERHAGFAEIAGALAAKPGFSPGLSTDDAIGILYAVQSEETYLLLVAEHGWTGERWEEWVLMTLLAQLFPGARRVHGLG
jgi:AcrR family transcriptional regulator